jgi:hypothetical protein
MCLAPAMIYLSLPQYEFKSIADELPDYIKQNCKRFGVKPELAYHWGMAESSHRDYVISHCLAYGRFQITEGWLREYERITSKRKPRPVTDLLDDEFNSYLWAWTIYFWRKQGYTDETIAQIYLFGEYGHVYGGRYSETYRQRIFQR